MSNVVSKIKNGATIDDTAAKYGLSKTTVAWMCHQDGVSTHGRWAYKNKVRNSYNWQL